MSAGAADADAKSWFDRPLTRAVGDATAKRLTKGLGLRTAGDLLRHYPRRYVERGKLTDFSKLVVGDDVTVMARVKAVSSRPMRNRKGSITEVVVTDGGGDGDLLLDGGSELSLTFFNQAWREKDLKPGVIGLFAGQVGEYRGARVVRRQLTHPDYLLLGPEDTVDDVSGFVGAVIPVYPATARLPSWKVSAAVGMVLVGVDDVADPVPSDIRARRRLLALAQAYRLVHRPTSWADVTRARQRLAYDEAFVLQVVLAVRRAEARALPATPRLPTSDGLADAFEQRLPFALTQGQQEVGTVLTHDLAADHPMSRLLQGEVGSGKTVVALRAMLQVVDAGGQAALLAPTEVLAQQHHRSITRMLGPLAERGLLGGSDVGTRVALLTGSQSTAQRRRNLLDVASGEAGIVVGTHALLEENVEFADLGLVVVDEQHRFGVEQRDALRAKGRVPPHVLVMTATPIPRTVAMTVFGDLEVSTLTELPAGRSPISTHVVPAAEKPAYLERAWQRVREEVSAGHQAYVVCPRIGEGDDTDGLVEVAEVEADDDDGGDAAATADRRPPIAVLDVAPMLAAGPLHGLGVEVLHGRLPADAKDDVMSRFAAGEIDVLVATTVVEVGVDVPNASTMVVLDADRFGVSQLHQLRGRVGRGSAPGLCLLVTDAPPETPARERLDAVASTLDGFELSRVDLAQRREGDVLGASQSGRRSSLRLLSVIRDEDLIVEARADAGELVDADPTLASHPVLARVVADVVEQTDADYLEKG